MSRAKAHRLERGDDSGDVDISDDLADVAMDSDEALLPPPTRGRGRGGRGRGSRGRGRGSAASESKPASRGRSQKTSTATQSRSIMQAFQAPSQRPSRTGATISYTADDLTIDDSDEDIPVRKPTRPPPKAALPSSSFTKSSSQSQSKSSRGIAFDDSDDSDEDNPFKGPSRR